MRLNKYLAEAGLGARRKVEELILNGKVIINGRKVTDLATQVDPKKDEVKVSNRLIRIEKKVYILLNKPAGYVTTVSDEKGRKTVLDLIPAKERVFPVGRLDKNSRGLLLLTNDGDLTARIIHPRHQTEKVYIVKVNKALTDRQLEKFTNGIVVDGRKTFPSKIKLISELRTPNSEPHYRVVLKEGRKRQIRLMLDRLGLKVLDLQRIQIGPLKLGQLKEGHWRYLSDKEVDNII